MKKIALLVIVIIVVTAFAYQNQIRDALVQAEINTGSFGDICITRMELQQNENSSHLRIYCDADEKLPLSDFESASGDAIGFSPLPGTQFVVHVYYEDSPHFLEKVTLPIRDKTTKEILFELTTRFWPKNVNKAG